MVPCRTSAGMRCQPLSRKSRNRCASSARTSALNTSLISGSDEALVSARRGQVAVRPKEGVANVRRSAALAGWPSARCKPGRSFSSYRWSKASGSIGVNTPLCVLSQVYLPATGGVMTNGELVATAPTSRSLTMTGSNRSSKVMAGVGVDKPVTSSTPSDRSGCRPAPAERRAEQYYPPPGRRVFVRNPGAMLEAQLRISVQG